MFDHSSRGKLLTPDGHICADYSRFSSPRSSLGEGLSTDCEADVESNLSLVSGELSGDGQNTLCRNSLTGSDWSHNDTDSEKNTKKGIEWKEISTERKIAFFIALISLLLVLIGFILFSTFDYECGENCNTLNVPTVTAKVHWRTTLNGSLAVTQPQYIDVDLDGVAEIILLVRFCKNSSVMDANEDLSDILLVKDKVIGSTLLAIQIKTGHVLRTVKLPFKAAWMHCFKTNERDVSCFCAGPKGNIATVNMVQRNITFQEKACTRIFSCSSFQSVSKKIKSIIACFCLWTEKKSSAYGLVIYSITNSHTISRSAIFESDVFASNVVPSPRTVSVVSSGIFRNISLILSFETNDGDCSIWMVPYTSIVGQLANKNEVGILFLRRLIDNSNCDLPPIQMDMNQDGVEDIVTVSLDKSLSVSDGQSNNIEQFATQDNKEIVGITNIPTATKPLLLLLRKGFHHDCAVYTLEILDPLRSMTSDKLGLPGLPTLTYAADTSNGIDVYMWINTIDSPQCQPKEKDMAENNALKRSSSDINFLKETTSNHFIEKSAVDNNGNEKTIFNALPSISPDQLIGNDGLKIPFSIEDRLSYWRSLLKPDQPSLISESGGNILPKTIQHLCTQIISNLEKLLQRHLQTAELNGSWDRKAAENFNVLFRQIEGIDDGYSHSSALDGNAPDEQEEYPHTEPYGDVYYAIISMILREVAHLNSIDLPMDNVPKRNDILIESLRKIVGTDQYDTDVSESSSYLPRREEPSFNDNEKQKAHKASISSPSPLTSSTAAPSSNSNSRFPITWCKNRFKLIRLVESGTSYQLEDITDKLRQKLPDESSMKEPCEKLVAKGITTTDDSIIVTLANVANCQTKIVKLAKP